MCILSFLWSSFLKKITLRDFGIFVTDPTYFLRKRKRSHRFSECPHQKSHLIDVYLAPNVQKVINILSGKSTKIVVFDLKIIMCTKKPVKNALFWLLSHGRWILRVQGIIRSFRAGGGKRPSPPLCSGHFQKTFYKLTYLTTTIWCCCFHFCGCFVSPDYFPAI